MSQDAVELVEAVVAHHQLPPSPRRLLDRNTGAELLGELRLEPLDVRVAGRDTVSVGPVYRRGGEAPYQCLGIAHREALFRHQQAHLGLLAAGGEPEERPGMAHLERALLEELRYLGRQLEEAQQVTDACAGAADRL